MVQLHSICKTWPNAKTGKTIISIHSSHPAGMSAAGLEPVLNYSRLQYFFRNYSKKYSRCIGCIPPWNNFLWHPIILLICRPVPSIPWELCSFGHVQVPMETCLQRWSSHSHLSSRFDRIASAKNSFSLGQPAKYGTCNMLQPLRDTPFFPHRSRQSTKNSLMAWVRRTSAWRFSTGQHAQAIKATCETSRVTLSFCWTLRILKRPTDNLIHTFWAQHGSTALNCAQGCRSESQASKTVGQSHSH